VAPACRMPSITGITSPAVRSAPARLRLLASSATRCPVLSALDPAPEPLPACYKALTER
jgi:hypothetical protein